MFFSSFSSPPKFHKHASIACLLCVCLWEISVASPLEELLKNPRDRQLENPEDFFEKSVRPVLAERCYGCHSAEAKKVRGRLLLDTREGLRRGGSRGTALIPGDAESSRLIQAVRYKHADLQMPPTGRLPEREIAALVRWVEMGAPDPRSDKGTRANGDFAGMSIEDGRKFWSFQPVRQLDPGTIDQSKLIERKIDAFILARLRADGLDPSPRAGRRTLVRRATFDVIGLPPTPDDVNAFVDDRSPDAYDRLVDRLLASPAYGERWARFWLDKARYADKLLYEFLNIKSSPWLYRDWVVNALNEDVPYDDFVRRQLATDMMPETGLEDLSALGFLGLSPTYWKELKLDLALIKSTVAEEWQERVDVLGRTFLGLTLACARCHDHKFDPVKQRDYYALAGVIASTRPVDRAPLPDEEWAVLAQAFENVRLLKEKIAKVNEKKDLSDEEKEKNKVSVEKEIKHIEETTPHYKTKLVRMVEDASLYVVPDGPARQKLEFRAGKHRDLHIHIRGDPSNPGPLVPRGFLTVLSPGAPRNFQKGSGRLELAEAIVDDAAPLAARVIVNRVWEYHFGRGIVDTPSNFGVQGSRPTHPRLLDDLSARFIGSGWSLKWLHREILLSATYRQSSHHQESKETVDPSNQLLWRMNRRRLEFESWRDSMLVVTGSLDRHIGGAPSQLKDPSNRRRSIYGLIDRQDLSNLLRLYDFPDPESHSPRREPTTTPLQQLFVLNSDFMGVQAGRLFERLERADAEDLRPRVQQVYQWLFGRPATTRQVELAQQFLDGGNASGADAGWKQYLHALLSSNEFAFVD